MPKDNYSDRKADVKAATKTKTCPTCGQKVSSSTQGGASVGGGT